MTAGKYEIKTGSDRRGVTVYYLVERATGKVMPGHYEFMSLALLAGLFMEY